MLVYCFLILLTFISESVVSKSNEKIIDINLLRINGDEFYEDKKGYTGILINKNYSPKRAIKMAIKENKYNLKILGVSLNLNEFYLNNNFDINDFPKDSIFILDLPDSKIKEILTYFPDNLILINTRSSNNIFRTRKCKSNLFHTIPSNKMYTDAIAQYLVEKNWKKVLVIYGPEKKDDEKHKSFLLSSKKYNIDIIESRQFTLSKNPEDRRKNNYSLISKGNNFDSIVIFDNFGEYSRKLPFNTTNPNLVLGDAGLVPKAWHWSWERNGGPQLNKRFKKDDFNITNERKNRGMEDNDWAAWASVKLIIEVLKKNNPKKNSFLDLFKSKDLSFDIYKGKTGSFREWNNQLRQPILLTTHNAVIKKMPSKKFIHKSYLEDTLGFEKNEGKCIRE